MLRTSARITSAMILLPASQLQIADRQNLPLRPTITVLPELNSVNVASGN
jgi:hypothetical protein